MFELVVLVMTGLNNGKSVIDLKTIILYCRF